MSMLFSLVFALVASVVEPHYVYLPLEGYDQFQPVYHYVVQRNVPLSPPRPIYPPAPSVPDISRETLEEHDDNDLQQHIQDVSLEQVETDPDDSQVAQRPIPPKLPIPKPLPGPGVGVVPRPSSGHLPSPRPSGPPPDVKQNGPNLDGSYDFSFKLPDQSRSEKGDSNGNVEGSYSYVGADGNTVDISYTAGAATGFVPVGEGLLPPPSAHGGDGSVQETQQPESPQASGNEEPEAYSYSYNTDLHSKTETADDNGNVEGSYTYIDGAGKSRTVTYTVRGDEGFIASGDIEPDAGSPDVRANTATPPLARPAYPSNPSPKPLPLPRPSVMNRPPHQPPVKGGQPSQEEEKEMPYSYNYKTDLSSKSETADGMGNVEGSYTYIDGAGVTRTVSYTVKGDEGFVASGDIHPDPGSDSPPPPPRPQHPPSANHGGNNEPDLRIGGKGIVPKPHDGIKGNRGHHDGIKGNKGQGWDKYPLGK